MLPHQTVDHQSYSDSGIDVNLRLYAIKTKLWANSCYSRKRAKAFPTIDQLVSYPTDTGLVPLLCCKHDKPRTSTKHGPNSHYGTDRGPFPHHQRGRSPTDEKRSNYGALLARCPARPPGDSPPECDLHHRIACQVRPLTKGAFSLGHLPWHETCDSIYRAILSAYMVSYIT